MPLHDGTSFLTKPSSNTLRTPAGDWGRVDIAAEYAVDGEPVQVEVLPLTAAQAASMNFPGEEPEKPKRAPRKTAATTTRTPRKPRETPAAE